jgi:hypothetical protein
LLGGIPGAPRAVLIAAVILGVVLLFVSPFLWRRSLATPSN